MSLDRDALLNLEIGDLPDDVEQPDGTWTFHIRAITPSDKGDALNIACEPGEPCDDVDPDALVKWEAEGDTNRAVFYRLQGETEKRQLIELKRLAKLIGISFTGQVRSLIGAGFLAQLSYQEGKDGTRYPRIRKLSPLPQTDEAA